jgi:hypothetical protein
MKSWRMALRFKNRLVTRSEDPYGSNSRVKKQGGVVQDRGADVTSWISRQFDCRLVDVKRGAYDVTERVTAESGFGKGDVRHGQGR